MSLRRIAFGSVLMSSVGVVRLMAQFFVIPLLSRLLSPEDYGVVALAMPFVLFTMIFSDAGLGQSLLRYPKRDPRLWSTCFWLSVFIGGGFAAAIALMTWPASLFFEEPRLIPILLALAPISLMQAACSIPQTALQQDQRFSFIAGLDVLAIAGSIGSAALVALSGGGVWALVVQQLVLYGVRFAGLMAVSSFRPGFHFKPAEAREHLIFGRDIIGAKTVYFMTNTVMTFIIGKVLGATLLGFHTMAFLFVRLPYNVITGPLQYVLYSHLAPHRENTELLRRTLLFLTRALAVLIFPAMGMVAAAHEPLFALVLSEKWALSGTLFMLAAPAAAYQAVMGVRGTFILIIGRSDIQFRLAFETFVLTILTLSVAVWQGLEWAVISYSLSTLLYIPRELSLTLSHLACRWSDYLKEMLWPVLLTLAAALAYFWVDETYTMPDWCQIGFAVFLGALCLFGGCALQWRSFQADSRILGPAWKKSV